MRTAGFILFKNGQKVSMISFIFPIISPLMKQNNIDIIQQMDSLMCSLALPKEPIKKPREIPVNVAINSVKISSGRCAVKSILSTSTINV